MGGAETSAVEPLVKSEYVEVKSKFAGAGAGAGEGAGCRRGQWGIPRAQILSRRWTPEPMQAGVFTASLMHHVVAREIRG